MQTPIRRRLAALLALAALTLAPALAAQDAPAIPADSRIRVTLTPAEGGELEYVGRAATSDRDSLRFLREGYDRPTSVAWGRVQRLERSMGVSGRSFGGTVAVVATGTAIGAFSGWSSWHTCRDPEDTTILSCIVAPGRLGTAVRGGGWLGFGLGTLFALATHRVERWSDLQLPAGPRLVIRNSIAGAGLGLRFAF